MEDTVASNGWTCVPVDAAKIFPGGRLREPEPLLVKDIDFPKDPLVDKIQRYAKDKLPWQTYNHSMRVFYFGEHSSNQYQTKGTVSLRRIGMAIVRQQFPEHAASFSPATLALSALLHDIGVTPENISATHMSFEFYGAIKALNLLQDLGGAKDQAEAVCEAIIRHQDLGTDGNITLLGQVIQLATIYDNVSSYPTMPGLEGIIHAETREDVIRAFPRTGWLGCFANVVREEKRLKPWCHTTHLPDFEKEVLGNELMKPYE